MPKRDTADELDLSVRSIADSLRAISESIKQCADRIESDTKSNAHEMLQRALRLIYKMADTRGAKMVFTGVGKSYLIGKKLAATMTSVGTPAICIHATEAVHGDLGMVHPLDCVVLLSYSGATDEVVHLASVLRTMRWGHPNDADDNGCTAGFCGNRAFLVGMSGAEMDSPLGKLCDAWIDCKVDSELSSVVCAPTTSSNVTLAMGDAISMLLMARRNFGPSDFARNHPGGQLGQKIT
ncbi:hypothetical protein IW140_004482 [Coemansia sp. RSA 1813]|nr:hypothetical protein EV178_004495 [Coemansia sp. RSA 1646]KAJ1769967.1 hypothetical protein LPJ74_003616 [Coemansia sp. RSA 1843]KAJ2087878.1 hypothetical protein IW138_004675 [Coemansia sp. RSA 986]KAJ2212771.1 hypothetical protein EV179_004424 [Coemansia sp. RSA 487]KAJ2567510.1 hypothetical protein IW140_004482 [Coemansia sp. RSA 1813]